jgi:hypothetical protein
VNYILPLCTPGCPLFIFWSSWPTWYEHYVTRYLPCHLTFLYSIISKNMKDVRNYEMEGRLATFESRSWNNVL